MPDTLQKQLKDAGLKVTRQRLSILETLSTCEARMTAEDIHFALLKQGESFSLSTVYRTLRALEEAVIVQRADIPGVGSGLYGLAQAGHRHYLMCVRCKRTVDMHCPVELFSKTACQDHGFRLTGHSFEIFGICPQCDGEAERGGAEHGKALEALPPNHRLGT